MGWCGYVNVNVNLGDRLLTDMTAGGRVDPVQPGGARRSRFIKSPLVVEPVALHRARGMLMCAIGRCSPGREGSN